MASDRRVAGDHGGWVVSRRVLVVALVRPVVVEVAHVLVVDGSGVSFVVDQHPVGAFGADAADEPLRITVRPGCARRDLDHGNAFGVEDGIEGSGERGIPVADQEAEGADLVTEVCQQVVGSLGGSRRGRVCGHAEQVDLPGVCCVGGKQTNFPLCCLDQMARASSVKITVS
jgi:hypothetical protein